MSEEHTWYNLSEYWPDKEIGWVHLRYKPDTAGCMIRTDSMCRRARANPRDMQIMEWSPLTKEETQTPTPTPRLHCIHRVCNEKVHTYPIVRDGTVMYLTGCEVHGAWVAIGACPENSQSSYLCLVNRMRRAEESEPIGQS